MKKILILLIGCVCFSACDNGELEQLRQENAQLKEQVVQLQKENKALKETEQGLFSKGIEKLNVAKSKQDWENVQQAFQTLLQKFPNSTYVAKANEYLVQANQRIQEIQYIDDGLAKIQSAIQQHQWKIAKKTLQNIKTSISSEQYEQLSTQIYEEQHKPIQTTLNAIGSDPDAFMNKRVSVKVSFSSSMSRERKQLLGYSNERCGGTHTYIYYDKTPQRTIQYFVNHDPNCMERMYRVVGVVDHGSFGTWCINAESIE